MANNTVVIGVIEDRAAARQTLQRLRDAGFHDDQLGFVVRSDGAQTEHEPSNSKAHTLIKGIVGGILGVADIFLLPITGPSDASNMLVASLPAAEEAIDNLPRRAEHEYKGKKQSAPSTPEQETDEPDGRRRETSTITGGVVGGALGAAAALLIPGIGPAIAGGILAVTLGGAAVGGITGSLLGSFIDMGVPEHKARYYEQELKAGRVLLSVHTAEQQQQAAEILRQGGAHDIEVHQEP